MYVTNQVVKQEIQQLFKGQPKLLQQVPIAQTSNLKPQTPNLKPQTSKHQNANPKPETLSP